MSISYEEAIKYLSKLTRFGVNFGLGRIEELMRRLDNPHLDLKVIHIGGTNGKGSTSAMMASILQAGGYRVGSFTSPHLHSYTERFIINGKAIAGEDLAILIQELRPFLEDMVLEGYEHPTEFEVCTALAFLYFKRKKVDFLVLEVGMGGAIDSTNVAAPIISVITNVGLDHMEYLGGTIAEIAKVKSGIIKPGVPLVTAADGEGLEVIREACKENGSKMILVGRDITWEQMSFSPAGQQFNIYGRRGKYGNLLLSLLGRHQLTNAATAVGVAEVLADLGVNLDEKAVRDGLASVNWPARLEILKENPLVIIDAAHNYDGAKNLRQALREYFPGRRLFLVIGMLEDKERTRVIAELATGSRMVVVTRPNSPRAGNWHKLAVEALKHAPEVYIIEDIEEAVKKAMVLAKPEDMICVTGSFYMVAEARELLLSTGLAPAH